MALVLLAVGAARNYGWQFVPPEMRGLLSKTLGACLAIALVLAVMWLARARLVLFVGAWLIFEELQVVICTIAYASTPWPIPEGAPMCSAKLGFDIGAAGIMIVAVLLWRITCKR